MMNKSNKSNKYQVKVFVPARRRDVMATIGTWIGGVIVVLAMVVIAAQAWMNI